MRLTSLLLAAAIALAATAQTPSSGCLPAVSGFARGADVSWLSQMEAEGRHFYTPGNDRHEMECMQLLRDYCGVNSIRLRVWVNPDKYWNSIPDVVAKAVRADSLGMRLMIDFHFSDTWADPGHQVMPAAWQGLPFNEQCRALADHVTATCTALRDAGVSPEWVQIGNETTPGMMLPVGSVDNPEQLTALNNAGYDAVKAIFPNALCIVHLDCGNNQAIYDRMFDLLESHGGRYDMIGMSLYPFWAQQNGETGGWEKVAADCIANVKHLKAKYHKPVMICEIGMPWDEGETCRELISRVMGADVEGIFYWEPQAPAGYNGGYTLGCFANDAPNAALEAFLPARRSDVTLNEGWQFAHGHGDEITAWQQVRVPHDWAIYGPFDRNNDLQEVAVFQNGESTATVKTGRTAGLPFIGRGTYRTTFSVADTTDRALAIIVDGAMSNAHVFVNGTEVAYRPYGYSSFYADISAVAVPGDNDLVVTLENYERTSRWYPGAGLYRNVHIVDTHRVHIPVWGTYITTPTVTDSLASVRLCLEIAGAATGSRVEVTTRILDPADKVVAVMSAPYIAHGQTHTLNLLVNDPELWSPESPALYTARTSLRVNGVEVDCYDTRFGIRSLQYIPYKGFFLNDLPYKFHGVCNHHDLGPLGAAVNRSALRHQLSLLKDMGVNAVRTSHNMPAPELVELCDEMGIMLMVEPFDDWSFRPKSPNGYGRFFNDWAQRDITDMVKHYRNNPSVVMWSIGNEVPSQWGPDGVAELVMLQDLVHALDPTRPVTCGMDQIGSVLDNGFAAALDIPGFNYKPTHYQRALDILHQGLVLGSETASTVSSRGVYHFPVSFDRYHNQVQHPDHQSSGYDNETCDWSNTPDIDFLMDEQPWCLGQFVWTGFDYLGEPSPYDTDAWPSHSSLFGIIDLASLPKDRFYLYRSQWNTSDTTLHILPHWNWQGREGEITPIFVYTSLPSAELFINGVSQGVRCKNDSTLQSRYRLMWNDVVYTPGEVEVVAYDADGNIAARRSMRTAGKPHHLVATPSRTVIDANGDELVYITIQVADKDGIIVPTDSRRVHFSVAGAGSFEATANGDPTCILPFQAPEMDLFSGAATAIVRGAATPGTLIFTVKARGLKPATTSIDVK